MTREEFIKQAIASGKPKAEIKRVFDAIEAAGKFDAPAEPTTPPDLPGVPPEASPSPYHPEPIWSKDEGEIVPKNVGPYYAQGVKNLVQRPMETLFPSASGVQGQGFGPAVKRNALGALDVLNWPDRAIDYASGGAFERGQGTIGEFIDKIPGQGTAANLLRGNLKTGAAMVTSPTTYVTAGGVAKAFAKETPESVARAMAKKTGLDATIKKGVDKGIKPTVRNKSNFSQMAEFEKRANKAVRTIAENKDKLNLVDELGEPITHPKSAAQFAQAIEQTKQRIYKQYHEMAVAAGDAGSRFDAAPVVSKLEKVADDLSYSPQIREYAATLKDELGELAGAAPDVVESRIKELNSSLSGFYEGRVSKAKAQLDASSANLMREELDRSITSAAGEGYQQLKNQYGALKSVEKEVNHRAIVNARRGGKSLVDMTDIFTGGDLVGGLISQNPALIARGVFGRATKEIIKKVNDPDRYIEQMFKKAYQEYTPQGAVKSRAPLLSALSNERGAIPMPEGMHAPYSRETIDAIADAAERHGGLSNIERVGTRPTFHKSVQDGYLWYNSLPDNSTRVTPVKPKGPGGQVATPNFKEWFGDWGKRPQTASKVVDAQGKPLVMYHGTQGDFKTFNTGGGASNIVSDKVGSHFGTVKAANDRLKTMPKNSKMGANIKPVYLDIKTPFTKKGGGFYTEPEMRKKFNEIASALGVDAKKRPIEAGVKVREWLKEKGYDGVPYYNSIEDKGSISYITLSPTQIKSATGNSGAFSKLTGDIRGSIGGTSLIAGTAAAAGGGVTVGQALKKKKKR